MPENMCLQGVREAADLLGQLFNNTGVGQALADDQYQRNDNGGRVTKPGKCLLFWHHTEHQRRDQRHEGNQVITQAPPDQQHEYNKQQRE